jgi:BirA family biotin operon repressor/biotin-[acetyl-CoA-carboxylase] ligase
LGEDLNVPLLNRLKANLGNWMAAEAFDLPRERLREELDGLTRAGAEIGWSEEQGARLLAWPDRLHPDELSWELGTRIIGRRILVFRETGSTNDVAWRLSETAEPEGTVVFAESQSRGRGRHGRQWHDAPGRSLLLSVLLVPNLPPDEQNALAVLGAVAVCEAVESVAGLSARIKWPNDVLVAGRKTGGILVETRSMDSQGSNTFVLGIGLNVNQAEGDFPPELRAKAASLRIVSGKPMERVGLARALLHRLDSRYGSLRNGESGELENAWRTRCAVGEMMELEVASQRFAGRVVDVSLKDGLILQLPSGGYRTFRGEHVTVRP